MLVSDAFHLPLCSWLFLTQFLCFVSSNLVHHCCVSQHGLFTIAHVCLHLLDAWHRRAPHLVLKPVQHIIISSANYCCRVMQCSRFMV